MQSGSRCTRPTGMTTVSNSVRTIAPVGHTSRQPAFTQCLQTSLIMKPAPVLPVGAELLDELHVPPVDAVRWPVLS